MTYGCFVDIKQQDGTSVRMHYPIEQLHVVKWIGINEQMANKFDPLLNGDSNDKSSAQPY